MRRLKAIAKRGAPFAIIFAMPLIVAFPAISQTPQGQKQTVANKQYGFSFTCPASWSVAPGHLPDKTPDIEKFKAGEVSIDFSLGKPGEGEENGVRLNGVKPSREEGAPLPPPTIDVSAHPAPAKSCNEFTKEFEEWMQMFRQKLVSAKAITTAKKLEGCDYVYTMQMGPHEVFSRMTVFFKQGKRYVLFYFEPNKEDFVVNETGFEQVLNSLTITE